MTHFITTGTEPQYKIMFMDRYDKNFPCMAIIFEGDTQIFTVTGLLWTDVFENSKQFLLHYTETKKNVMQAAYDAISQWVLETKQG